MLKFSKLDNIFSRNLSQNFFIQNKLNKFFPSFNFATQVGKKEEDPKLKTKHEELKPEPFVPFEKFSKKHVINKKKENLKETYFYFGNEKMKFAEKNYNVMEFYSKGLRREYIKSGEIDSWMAARKTEFEAL